MRRTGGAREIKGRYYFRVRAGKGQRITVALSACKSQDEADSRAGIIADVVRNLIESDRLHEVKEIAESLGAAESDREIRILKKAALKIEESVASIPMGESVEKFGERWTSGLLHAAYPDHVKLKDSRGDKGILDLYVNKIAGRVPIRDFNLNHADAIMRSVPRSLSTARRRHVAQVIHRLLSLAVFPAKLRADNPLPKGWLPPLAPHKDRGFLYPKEELLFLGNRKLDLRKRLFVGFLNREGPRKSRAANLTWADFNLDLDGDRGTVSLPRVKKSPALTWVLEPGTVRALRIWKRLVRGRGPFVGIGVAHLGEWLRDALKSSGVTRAQLFDDSDERHHFRAHDTRSTFVTYALAHDRTPDWIAERTGHRGWAMILRYKSSGSLLRQLDLGPLAPLDQAVPDLSDGTARLPRGWGKSGATEVPRADVEGC